MQHRVQSKAYKYRIGGFIKLSVDKLYLFIVVTLFLPRHPPVPKTVHKTGRGKSPRARLKSRIKETSPNPRDDSTPVVIPEQPDSIGTSPQNGNPPPPPLSGPPSIHASYENKKMLCKTQVTRRVINNT